MNENYAFVREIDMVAHLVDYKGRKASKPTPIKMRVYICPGEVVLLPDKDYTLKATRNADGINFVTQIGEGAAFTRPLHAVVKEGAAVVLEGTQEYNFKLRSIIKYEYDKPTDAPQ